MQAFIYKTLEGNLFESNKTFNKSNNPKISIVIPIYNGESYIKSALISIQNQDFNDLEIIMIDDFSEDNTIKLIKEFMIKDPRIILLQNEENKGILFTKTKGILSSKGKYVMILNVDDIYVQRDAFSTLYKEAEKNNLDILGFGSIESEGKLHKGQYISRYMNTSILFQPYVSKMMYDFANNNKKVKRIGDAIFNYFFKADIFINVIKQIEQKFLKTKTNFNDDFFLFFLITRKAKNLRQIKRIFYIKLKRKKENENSEINKDRDNLRCLAYINYIEFLLTYTDNNDIDKKISSFELDNFLLNNKCRVNKLILDRAILVCKLFLENKYIEIEEKNKIHAFLNETRKSNI